MLLNLCIFIQNLLSRSLLEVHTTVKLTFAWVIWHDLRPMHTVILVGWAIFYFPLMIFEVFPLLQCAFHLIIVVFVCCYPSVIESISISLCDVLQKLKPVYILLNKTIPDKQQIPRPHHITSFLSLQSCSSATENQTNMKMISVAFTTGLSIYLSFISF